jgi:hypothetical protein
MRLIIAGLLTALSACNRGGAMVTVFNQSPDTLHAVVLSGRGFADTLAELAPAQLAALRVRPRGESGLKVAFTADNRRIVVPEQVYLESCCGYVVLVEVDSTLTVRVHATLERYR